MSSNSSRRGSKSGVSRRQFLGRAAGTAALTMTGVGVGSVATALPALAVAPSGTGGLLRRNQAFNIRLGAANYQKNRPLPAHRDNGDEALYATRIGNFSKTLPHNAAGEVDPAAYNALRTACLSGSEADFEAVPAGGAGKLVTPQAAYTFNLEGADSAALGIPAPPAFASLDEAGEMAELYWMALTRDVHFSDYATNPVTLSGAAEQAGFPNFGWVNAGNLFRAPLPGVDTGPYVSQFLYKDIPYGATTVTQKYKVPVAAVDHMLTLAECVNLQNGGAPSTALTLDSTPRYLRNGRDLGEWVHRDYTYQGGLDAALILLSYGGGALNPTNPYLSYGRQAPFVNFGAVMVLDLVARTSWAALKAAWYQKWVVHRRLRPEAFSARVHAHVNGMASYPIHPALLNSQALAQTQSTFSTSLQPQAYPEGCPAHPAYPAGHPTLSGAFTTILKAFFKESFEIPSPVVASADGLSLVPYAGTLTVGGELNKLALNIARARDVAGVHWYTDGYWGAILGEQIAIQILTDLKNTLTEDFVGWSFTKFDGTTAVI
jgi:hypothetical protein